MKASPMYVRITADIVLLIVALTLPWWVTVLLAIGAMITFNMYLEMLVLGVVVDSLYNAPQPRLFNFQFAMTLALLGCFVVFTLLKTRLRVYH